SSGRSCTNLALDRGQKGHERRPVNALVLHAALSDGAKAVAALDPLSRLNVECDRMANVTSPDVEALAASVVHADSFFAPSNATDLLRSINATRRAADIATVASVDALESALQRRADEVIEVYRATLDRLAPRDLLDCFDVISAPSRQQNRLVRGLVTHYKKHAVPILVGEGDKVIALCRRGTALLSQGQTLSSGYIDRVQSLLGLYHRLLRPMSQTTQGPDEARTVSRMMQASFAEFVEAAQSQGHTEMVSQLVALRSQYFRRH
ncbi:MAG: hypothetical protein AAF499_17880, partial [Pseudomonadota bacterium]